MPVLYICDGTFAHLSVQRIGDMLVKCMCLDSAGCLRVVFQGAWQLTQLASAKSRNVAYTFTDSRDKSGRVQRFVQLDRQRTFF